MWLDEPGSTFYSVELPAAELRELSFAFAPEALGDYTGLRAELCLSGDGRVLFCMTPRGELLIHPDAFMTSLM